MKQFLELPNGIPSRDCIRRVLRALKSEVFQESFESWIANLVNECVTGKGIVAIDGTTSGDARYFISSAFMSGKRFAEAVRGHWAIENSLHWVLDVTFDEDHSRTRKRRIADNLSWPRRFAISLLKRHPSKNSIKGKS